MKKSYVLYGVVLVALFLSVYASTASAALANGDCVVWTIGQRNSGNTDDYAIVGAAKLIITDVEADPVDGNFEIYDIESDSSSASSDYGFWVGQTELFAMALLAEDVVLTIDDQDFDCYKYTSESGSSTTVMWYEQNTGILMQMTSDDGTTDMIIQIEGIYDEDVDLQSKYGQSIDGFPLGILALIGVTGFLLIARKVRN